MHIVTRKLLNEFAGKYPETKTALVHWYQLVKQNDFIIRAVLTHAEYDEDR
jgi:mRNA interferase HigB